MPSSSGQVYSSDLDIEKANQNQASTSTLISSGLPIPFPPQAAQQDRYNYLAASNPLSSSSWVQASHHPSNQYTLPASSNYSTPFIDSNTANNNSTSGNMASSHTHTFQAQPSVSSMDQHIFPTYSHQQLMTSSFYNSFSIVPNQMPTRMDEQQAMHLQQPYQQMQQQGPSSLLRPLSQPISRGDSVEDDDDYDGEEDEEEEEEDNSEVMIPQDDIETRLKVAQAAQDAAASEGPNGVFACPYCDKRYNGKHARSIWRRHLQDKHAIPLSQQPRRTRWDGDANRPKNAEERRQRMLESKRRWARKKRQSEKSGSKGAGGDESFGETSPSDSSFHEPQKNASSTQAPPPKKRSVKPKGPQQLKFHNMTPSEMPPFVDFGSSSGTGNINGGGMLWPTSSNNMGSFQTSSSMGNRVNPTPSSTLSSAHNFNPPKGNKMTNLQPQHTFAMMTSIPSPRKALGQLDSNAIKSSRLQLPHDTQQDPTMAKLQMIATSPRYFTMDTNNKTTPMNRYSQLYPTPPSAGDPKISDCMVHDMKPSSKTIAAFESNGMPLLSPPVSHHNGESSPSYLGGVNNALCVSDMGRRSSSSSVFAPVLPRSDILVGQRSPANNPFSLDRHKISPTNTVQRKIQSDALQPPVSANRLSSVLEDGEHKLSPIQNRTLAEGNGKDMASPLEKERKLPPLVKTPLRPFVVKDEPTPSNATGLLTSMGSVSLRRVRPSGAAGVVDPWKALNTPTEEHNDRMLGGFTPFHAQSAKYSTTRGLGSVTRPSRGGESGDQFSSPQHPNLSQSLSLAPQSVGKGGLGGFGMGSATPYVTHFLANNSPWPDSIIRPTFKTSSSKRGRDDIKKEDESSNEGADEDDDEEEDNGGLFVHETPSRPAKHRRSSILLGSENNSATIHNRLPSSAAREQHPMKPILFNLSSDRDEKTSTTSEAKDSRTNSSSLDSDMTGNKSSLLSASTSRTGSDDGSDGVQSPTIKKRSFS